jgi:hypothetical protein
MNSSCASRCGRLSAWLRGIALGLALAVTAVQAQDAVRPEVGKPLLAAQHLIKEKRYQEALAKIGVADTVGGKTAEERELIERMRLSAASAAGDNASAAKAFEALEASGRLSAAEKLTVLEALAGGSYRAADYARAASWARRYLKDGGTSAAVRELLVQSLYLQGDYAGTVRELGHELRATRGAPAEDRLQLLLNAALKQGDSKAAGYALEQLAVWYPKKEYWLELIARAQRQPGWSSRLALDAWRLRLATGSMGGPGDYLEMAQLALLADLPAEAGQVVDAGYAAKVLGHGAEAPRHQRLRELAAKRSAERRQGEVEAERQARAAPDGSALLTLGLNRVYAGDAKAGLELMQQGLDKGGLEHPDDARLHLAVAYLKAGDREQAQKTFKTVAGQDGSAALARLWALQARAKG